MKLFEEKEKNTEDFAKLICALKAAELLGLARMLGVRLFYEDVKDEQGHPMPRSGEAIVEDCLVKFYALNRSERRRILKALRSIAKGA